MILILSRDELEDTTNRVIDWLDYFGANYVRLNGAEFNQEVVIEDGKMVLDSIDLDRVNIIWNRRWISKLPIDETKEAHLDAIGAKNAYHLLSSLLDETHALKACFNRLLASKKWTTKPYMVTANKLQNLTLATQCGLQTPKYIITTKKKIVSRFLKNHHRVICKPIAEVPTFSAQTNENTTESLIIYTSSYEADQLIEELPESFKMSMFQQEIDKEYEIRVFYLNGACYSMAIFSQQDPQTSVDFRNYNRKRPNRNVPFKLPLEIEDAIIEFCKKGGYTIGSIDLIKSKDGGYYFLEINPVGQFGMVSYPCNYNLEKKLAKYLIDEDQFISERNLKELV
ncbi:hypothetical protein IMCC3317_12460 [Kordia antarctica]|uniref:ATP-grasp domain-containing protein n=1 Tax=Kordia antarctica TaxID=1218801 RepID=A0A7L4ZGL6_9FLAO|nr:grasp-with-spasm system ATP-grasp peptide maturase [Kordia antarctica]QHI35898.1 hypothetical protein IMCC3317_12460 [Kordia antarctica]